MERADLGGVGEEFVGLLVEKVQDAIAEFPAPLEERVAIRDAVAADVGRMSVDG